MSDAAPQAGAAPVEPPTDAGYIADLQRYAVFDESGLLEPREPFSWETLARCAIDLANATLLRRGAAPAAERELRELADALELIGCSDRVTITGGSPACIEAAAIIRGLAAERVTAVPVAPNDRFLCFAWGETDLPCAHLARSRDEVQAFIVEQWLGSADSVGGDGEPMLPDIMQEFDEFDWREEKRLVWEFEIGGVQIEKVYTMLATPLPAAAPVGEALLSLDALFEAAWASARPSSVRYLEKCAATVRAALTQQTAKPR